MKPMFTRKDYLKIVNFLKRNFDYGYIGYKDGSVSIFILCYLSYKDAKHNRSITAYLYRYAKGFIPTGVSEEEIKEIYFLTDDFTKILFSEV